MSWLDIKVWLEEQKRFLEGSYIDNIYVADSLIVLKLRAKALPSYVWLVIEPGRRISITRTEMKFVSSGSSGKQQIWRRMVRNCIIVGVEQLDLERVVLFGLRCGSTERKLVVELLPRGVAAVLDQSNKIVLTTESRSMKDRIIRPGVLYRPPPLRKPFTEMSVDELLQSLKQGKDVVRGLIRGWGLPPEVAETIIQLCGIDPSADPASIDNEALECLRRQAEDLVNKVTTSPAPCIVYSDGELVGFYPFVPFKYAGARIEKFERFNDAVDTYFQKILEYTLSKKVAQELETEMRKLEKSVEDIDRRIAEAKRGLEDLRKRIEVLESKYIELEELHNCVTHTVKEHGWREVVRDCSREGIAIARVEPKQGIYAVCLDGIELELNVRKNLVEVYSELRKKVSDLENAVKRAEEEKQRLLKRIEELRTKTNIERKRIRHAFARKPEWYERFHWMITSTGFLVIGGRDASQNVSILRRYAEPSDIVMHADIHGASAVVLKTGGKEVDEETLSEAAVLAACYSKAWKAGYASIDVFWVRREQISFSAPSGEYLPRGSFMVYGKKNYVRGVKLELAVGIERQGDGYRVIVGPEKVVAQRAIAYIVLVPGDEDPSTIAKSFVRKLRESSLHELAELIDVNEVSLRIPGKSKMVKYVSRKA